ncbi:ECF-type sigma factor [Marinicella sp. S1101]|nr:ECF-type sigma factor [Marinicella marina]MCX7552255.1 ECF-type sigma factor [Marinicella marina]MDJ1139131.1 ECF-type sigma factor [Marinicella marina]
MTDSSITYLLHDKNLNHTQRINKVYAACYGEVKVMARRVLGQLPNNETITPTVLMHECYLKILKQESLNQSKTFKNSKHFIFSLAKSMRCYLIDVYRSKQRAPKKYYNQMTQEIGDKDVHIELMDLEYIFDRIEKFNAEYAQLIDLKVFAGLEVKEISGLMRCSERQVIRKWKVVKALIQGVQQQSSLSSI